MPTMGRSHPLGQLRRRSANVSAQRTFDQAAAFGTMGGKCEFAAGCTKVRSPDINYAVSRADGGTGEVRSGLPSSARA